MKTADGAVEFFEFDQDGGDPDAARLAALFDRLDSLISDEDVNELAADLAPDLRQETLPSEVRALIDSFDSKTLFIKNAQRIIEAQRAETNTGVSPA